MDDQTNEIFLDQKNRVVKKPGYEIIILNIQRMNIFVKNELLYITLSRENKQYTFLIGDYIEKNSK